ncbi:MAG TPA: TonB-dependent receptor plug domain-containing protein, partial [Saprospiraceae bacterium]|nr:TonB-dependent receptor plug domain-containing protein [Saprospiraceae bacterium]
MRYFLAIRVWIECCEYRPNLGISLSRLQSMSFYFDNLITVGVAGTAFKVSIFEVLFYKKSGFMRFWTLLILLNFFALQVCTQPLAPADSVTWELLLKDVVVTAQYAPTDSKNAVHPIRTIRQETIQQRGANNLEELLNQELNVRIQQDLILGSALSLQGVSGQNVKIMIDGVPVIGRMGDNVDLSQINLHQIERVELVEGPLSVQYGTNALGGVINLISKKSQLKKFETGATLQAESAGWKNWAANLGARLHPKILWQISGGQNNFEGLSADSTRAMLWNPKAQKFTETSLRFNWAQDHSLRYTLNWFEEQVDDVG